MALSQENTASTNSSVRGGSQKQQSGNATQLEGLLDLLVELQLVEAKKSSSSAEVSSSSQNSTATELLENLPSNPLFSLQDKRQDPQVESSEPYQFKQPSVKKEKLENNLVKQQPKPDKSSTTEADRENEIAALETLENLLFKKPKQLKKQERVAPTSKLDLENSSEAEEQLPALVMKAELIESWPAQPQWSRDSNYESEFSSGSADPPNIPEEDIEEVAGALSALQALLFPAERKQKEPGRDVVVNSTESLVDRPEERPKEKAEKSIDTPSLEAEINGAFKADTPEESAIKISENPADELSLSLTVAEKLPEAIAIIQQKLENLERQSETLNPLLPLISEMVGFDLTVSKDESIRLLVPIIDKIIRERTQQDREAMSEALAALIPAAITKQIHNSPEEIAKAIAPEISVAIKEQIRLERDSISQVLAPEMGRAIKAQIELERDSMVDALYPVIGNTISKYMVEAIRSINEKVENALSLEGIKRKIRAKVQGVSEAELILQESIQFKVQAVFLIHKTSGLVIAEAQPLEENRLESDMVAGMLTAIRSFVNDCIAQSGNSSELNQVEYGGSKIILEVAGYCYLAVVIDGEPPRQYIQQIREALGIIIQKHGKPIEEFDGDPETVPEKVVQLIDALIQNQEKAETNAQYPLALLLVILGLFSAIAIPWGIGYHRDRVEHQVETQVTEALAKTPELSIYGIDADAERNKLTITGRVPNDYLRSKAEQIARETAPDLELDNQIDAVEIPADPVLTTKEVERTTSVLNQKEGVSISTRYEAGNVTVAGTVFERVDAEKIARSLEEIPGVSSVVSTLELQVHPLDTRIYFNTGSAKLKPEDLSGKIAAVETFLKEYPETYLTIIGHSDSVGTWKGNQQLSIQRAEVVKTTLERQGIDPKRLQTFGTTEQPPDVSENSPLWLSRVVRFELFIPVVGN